jgi:hypothetical protein
MTDTENTQDEQTNDAFAQAVADQVKADILRQKITQHVAGAVKYGVDRDWANGWLVRLGAAPITGTAEYRMNMPLTGVYGWRCKATSRAEATRKFMEQVNRVASQGKITADGSYDNVYEVTFPQPLTPAYVNFYAGPEDPDTGEAEDLTLDGLKDAIRLMVKEGIVRQGWNLGYATRALASMGLDSLGTAHTKAVKVPVTGYTEVSVLVFEGDDDSAVQEAAAGVVTRSGAIYIKPEEIGTATIVPDPEPVSEDQEDEEEDIF